MFFLKNKRFLYNFFFQIVCVSSIFFWSVSFGFIELKHAIILLLIPIIYNKKFYKKDFIILLLCIIIFFHKIFNNENTFILESILISLYIFIVIKILDQYYEKIICSISYQINLFLIFFILSSLWVSIYQFYNFNIFYGHCVIGCFSIFKTIFFENSHLAMSASSLILYTLFLYSKGNRQINPILFVTFIIICLLNFSLTLIASVVFNVLFFLIIFWKEIDTNRKYITYLTLTFIFCLIFIFNNSTFKTKIFSVLEPLKLIVNYDKNENKDKLEFQDIQNKHNISNKNLSSDVLIKSFKITIISLINHPFGIGINNFEIAHEKYINDVDVNFVMTKKLNVQDGSNNLSKIVTEFGIFSLFLFYLIAIFTFSRKIEIEYKIFLLPNIFTQLIFRGAGYFNGGFLIFIIIMTYIIINKYK